MDKAISVFFSFVKRQHFCHLYGIFCLTNFRKILSSHIKILTLIAMEIQSVSCDLAFLENLNTRTLEQGNVDFQEGAQCGPIGLRAQRKPCRGGVNVWNRCVKPPANWSPCDPQGRALSSHTFVRVGVQPPATRVLVLAVNSLLCTSCYVQPKNFGPEWFFSNDPSPSCLWTD